jgi:hypothetical protein
MPLQSPDAATAAKTPLQLLPDPPVFQLSFYAVRNRLLPAPAGPVEISAPQGNKVIASARRIPLNAVVEVLINLLLPYLIYRWTDRSLGDVHALMAASAPPILWSAAEFARKRRIDAMSALVIAGIALSLLAFLGGGSVRFLQLRENLVTGLIALAFLGSAAIGRPLIYQLALASQRRRSKTEADHFETLHEKPGFRRSMMTMTLVWGFGLLFQTAAACLLVFQVPIATYLILSPILGYGTMGLLALWNVWYVRRKKRAGAVREAAQAPQPADPLAGELGQS